MEGNLAFKEQVPQMEKEKDVQGNGGIRGKGTEARGSLPIFSLGNGTSSHLVGHVRQLGAIFPFLAAPHMSTAYSFFLLNIMRIHAFLSMPLPLPCFKPPSFPNS